MGYPNDAEGIKSWNDRLTAEYAQYVPLSMIDENDHETLLEDPNAYLPPRGSLVCCSGAVKELWSTSNLWHLVSLTCSEQS